MKSHLLGSKAETGVEQLQQVVASCVQRITSSIDISRHTQRKESLSGDVRAEEEEHDAQDNLGADNLQSITLTTFHSTPDWMAESPDNGKESVSAIIKKHLSESKDEKREQEVCILKQEEMHTNRLVACLSGNDFTGMALNSPDVASAALCFQLVDLKNNFRIVVLTIPVHNIKVAFLQECLEQGDLDLQSVGVFFDATGSDNAVMNSQVVRRMGVRIKEVVNDDGTTDKEYGSLFPLNKKSISWIPDPVQALKNIRNNFTGSPKRVMHPFYMDAVGTIDPGILEYLLRLDTQPESGLSVVLGYRAKL